MTAKRLVPTGVAATFGALLLALAPPSRGAEGSFADLEARLVRLAEHATPRTAVVYGAIGLGSAAVVDPRGTAVTNAHVGLAARVAILEFADGRRVAVRRRGIDLERDLAVYEPETELAEPAPCFELAAGRPTPGDWVIGVGYPGGPRGDLRPTVSLGRAIEGGGLKGPVMGFLRYDDAIRTDLAIFSGNSGGPLVDLEGRLLGINGAIQPGEAGAFAVPIEVVKDRLVTLRGGTIRFSDSRKLDATNPAVRALDRALEPITRQMVERVRDAFSPAGGAAPALPHAARKLDDPPSSVDRDALARVLRESPRSKELAGALRESCERSRGAAVLLEGGVLATRVDRRHVVAKASLLGNGRASLVGLDEANDLALLELDLEAGVRLPEDAPLRPAGSIVAVLGTKGALACGIVSVGSRPIPEAVSLRIASGGMGDRLLVALRSLERLADRLGNKDLRDLLATLRTQLELQGAINRGNEPRGYERVLSHDAALAPSEAGAPLVDREGRLVGVNVANANYGTSYAVPIHVVRETFAKQLGGARIPLRLGKARLY